MKKEMLKRTLVITLAFLVAFVGLPLNAMAIQETSTIEIDLSGNQEDLENLTDPVMVENDEEEQGEDKESETSVGDENLENGEVPEKDEKPLGDGEVPEKDEKPLGDGEVPEDDEKTLGDGEVPEEDEKPLGDGEVPEDNEKPLGDGEVPEDNEKPLGDDKVPEDNEKPLGDGEVPEEDEKPLGDGEVLKDDKESSESAGVKDGGVPKGEILKENNALKVSEATIMSDTDNLWVSGDDKYILYLNNQQIGDMVISKYSTAKGYTENIKSGSVIAAWAADTSGTATIAGFKLYGTDDSGQVVKTDDDWYYSLTEPASYSRDGETIHWYHEDYVGDSWSVVTVIDPAVNGKPHWASPVGSEEWIWSANFKPNPRIDTPIYLRSRNVITTSVLSLNIAENEEIKRGVSTDLSEELLAYDTKDGDVTDQVQIYYEGLLYDSNTFSSNVLGEHVFEYKVTNSNNETQSKIRTITVKDDEAPVLTVGESITVYRGETVDLKSGVSAVDDIDGDLTGEIHYVLSSDGVNSPNDTSGVEQDLSTVNSTTIDTVMAETITVTYLVKDQYDHEVWSTRTIYVLPFEENKMVLTGTGQVGVEFTNTTLNEQFADLVLLAQLQTYNEEKAGNLRNNILMSNYGEVDLANQRYMTNRNMFTTELQFADKTASTQTEQYAYLAMDTGLIMDDLNDVVGYAGQLVVDFNDELYGSVVSEKPVDAEWHRATWQGNFNNPVVIAQLASTTGMNATHLRVADIDPATKSFKVFVEEWDADQSTYHHNVELVSYVVFEAGEYVIDGKDYLVKKINDSSYASGFEAFRYNDYVNAVVFSQTQNVLISSEPTLTVQTKEKPDQVWMRQKNVTQKSVELFIHDENGGKHVSEDIGVVVIGNKSPISIPVMEINPDMGVFNDIFEVRLSATDDDRVDIIKYKINGGTEVVVSNPFTLTLESSLVDTLGYVNIEAYAVDEFGYSSEVKTGTYRYDNIAPVVEIKPTEEFFSGTLEVTIEASDDATEIYYTLDGSDPRESATKQLYTNSFSVSTSTLVRAVALDEAGNSGTDQQQYTYDERVPSIEVTPNHSYFVDDLLVSMSSNFDDATIMYTFDSKDVLNRTWLTYTGPITIDESVEIWSKAIRFGNYESGEVHRIYEIVEEVIIVDPDVAHIELEKVLLSYGYNGTTPLADELRNMQLAYEIKLKDVGSTHLSMPYTISKVTWYVKRLDDGTYTIEDDVISVDENGRVYGKNTGNSLICVDVELTPVGAPDTTFILTDSVEVQVNYSSYSGGSDENEQETTPAPITIEIDADIVTLDFTPDEENTDSIDLNAIIRNTSNKATRWEISSNPFLTIDQNGLITFKATPPAGIEDFSATVTATSLAGNVSDTARVLLNELIPESPIQFFNPYVFGYPDESFKPDKPVTRAEVATMFATILEMNLDFPGTQKYSDVEPNQWYYNYVQAIARTNIFVGDGSGYFRPDEPITRAELSAVFAKFWQYKQVEVNDKKVVIKDVTDSHWASTYIYMMYNAGVVTNYGDGTYQPESYTLRKEVVKMINDLIERPENKAIASKFNDITNDHPDFSQIEAAAQPFLQQFNIPVEE